MIQYKYVDGHVEVFQNGLFLVSADTMEEAHREVMETQK